MSDSLQEYGIDYQHKLVACLFSDAIFLQQIFDILESSSFSSDAVKWIVDWIKVYFHKYKTLPHMSSITPDVGEISNDILKMKVIESLKDSLAQMNSNDLEFVKDKALDFFKNQRLKNAILYSVDLIKTREYDKIKEENQGCSDLDN